MFNTLQQALFALAFDDEEPSDEALNTKSILELLMVWLILYLRGLGFAWCSGFYS